MDAVIAGLIGSFGGVIVGALAQAMHATRQRRWQVEDLERVEKKERRNRLWEDRRILYAATLTSMDELVDAIHQSLVLSSREARDEAVGLLAERVNAVSRRVSELRMISESASVMDAAVEFLRVATAFSPVASVEAPQPVRVATWNEMQPGIHVAFHGFHAAARDELGFEVPLPAPRQPAERGAGAP
ncbi:hypothetical protein [Streptomyces hydrogenans]|uniref:hypothetical protein n=1 Tax=Streptomyces hydrogenans TaxID=1873719 RepID=UPI0035E06A02